MNKSLLTLLFLFGSVSCAQAVTVVDFDELTPGGGFFDGYSGSAASGTWTSQGVAFNTNPYGPGWSYSNVKDNTTAGFANQFAAFTNVDFSGSGNYVIGSAFFGGAYFDIPTGYQAESLRVSNATYAALSMLAGDSFAKQFGGPSGNDPDFFKVTFVGHSLPGAGGTTTGSVDFYLADYRFADPLDDYIVDTWELVDLTSLGNARSIDFEFAGSDIGEFGLNTPAYVAIDNLVLTAPEPSSVAVLAVGGLLTLTRRRTKR